MATSVYKYLAKQFHEKSYSHWGAFLCGFYVLPIIMEAIMHADISEVLAELDQLLPGGMLERALEIVDKGRVIRLCTSEDGLGPSLIVVQPSRSSQWARRNRNAEAEFSLGSAEHAPQLGDTFHGVTTGATMSSKPKAPYVVSHGMCSCPDFFSGVSSEVQYRPMVSCGLCFQWPSHERTAIQSQCKHVLAVHLAQLRGPLPLKCVSPEALSCTLSDAYTADEPAEQDAFIHARHTTSRGNHNNSNMSAYTSGSVAPEDEAITAGLSDEDDEAGQQSTPQQP